MCFTTRIFKLIFHSLKKSTYLLSKGLLWLYVKKKKKKNTWLLAVMELLFSCSTRYQEIITIYFLLLDTSLVHWPHSWDSELNTLRRNSISTRTFVLFYLLNEEKMVEFVIQRQCKIPEKLPCTTSFDAYLWLDRSVIGFLTKLFYTLSSEHERT